MSRHKRHLLIFLSITAVIMLAYTIYICFVSRGYTQVTFINVGEGDSAFLKTEHHRSVLIDGGDKGSGEYMLVPFLRAQRTNHLDAVFISHNHDDHISGIVELINGGFSIEKIYVSDKALYCKELSDAVSRAGIPVLSLKEGEEAVIDTVRFTAVSTGYLGNIKDDNDRTLMLRADCGETSFLFTGDATVKMERQLLKSPLLDTDVLKIAHHGSDTSTAEEFLQKVSPDLAIISVSEDNSYGHPAQEVLDRLQSNGIPVLRTDRNGSITVIMDKQGKITSINQS